MPLPEISASYQSFGSLSMEQSTQLLRRKGLRDRYGRNKFLTALKSNSDKGESLHRRASHLTPE